MGTISHPCDHHRHHDCTLVQCECPCHGKASVTLPSGEGRDGCPCRELDVVNHPAHYTAHPSGVECITVTEHFNFNVGNAIKYLWRSGLKGAAIEDLKKARWYVDREIQRLGGDR